MSDKKCQIFKKWEIKLDLNVNDDKSAWSSLNFTFEIQLSCQFELAVKKVIAEQISRMDTTHQREQAH